jgi:hypothetical protein
MPFSKFLTSNFAGKEKKKTNSVSIVSLMTPINFPYTVPRTSLSLNRYYGKRGLELIRKSRNKR